MECQQAVQPASPMAGANWPETALYTSQDPSISIDGARKGGQKKNSTRTEGGTTNKNEKSERGKKGTEQKGNRSERKTNKVEREI